MQLSATAQGMDLTPVIVPPRSRLHHLEPIGIGMGTVESLTGFASRLAVAHDVTLAALFGREIAPLLNKEHLRRSEARSNKNAVLAISFRPMERAVNGTGATARTFAEALEKLTMRVGLSYLTMLTWKDVISHRHLIRTTKAWCPACYEEWRLEKTVIYEPLLWSLEVVSSCPDHRRRLRTHCDSCHQSLHPLGSRSRPGYCSSCNAWLGETRFTPLAQEEALDKSELEWQGWAAKQVGELLSAAPALTHHPLKAIAATCISRCIAMSPFRNEFEFARNLKVPQSTLNDWRTGKHVPQLDGVLRVCRLARVSLLDFILGRLPEQRDSLPSPNKEAAERHTKSRARSPRRWTKAEISKAKAVLEAALEENPPPPMIEISRRLDRSSSTLQARFKGLCKNVITRHAIYRREGQLRFWDQVRLSLEAAIKAESPPCPQEVARGLGCSKTVLVKHFPELCGKLSRLYQGRRGVYWGKVKLALETALEESYPPRPMRMLAKELGCSYTSTLNYFPDLCRQLASRYAHYRREESQEKESRLRQKIRDTALEIYGEGKYPTVRRVSKRLTQPRYLRSSKVGLAALREVCSEINEKHESSVEYFKDSRLREC